MDRKSFFSLSGKGLGLKALSFSKKRGISIFDHIKNFWKTNMSRY